jgi:hypothetical protein
MSYAEGDNPSVAQTRYHLSAECGRAARADLILKRPSRQPVGQRYHL